MRPHLLPLCRCPGAALGAGRSRLVLRPRAGARDWDADLNFGTRQLMSTGDGNPLGETVEVATVSELPRGGVPPAALEAHGTDGARSAGGADGGGALDRRLADLRPHLGPGAVFAADDALTGRTGAPKQGRPIVLVGPQPPDDVGVVAALTWKLATSTRVSWKDKFSERYGPPPLIADADGLRWMQGLLAKKLVFTPAGLLPAFDRPGVFELEPRRWIAVSDLVRCPFLGWLDKPWIDWLTASMTGVRLPDPYPPPRV